MASNTCAFCEEPTLIKTNKLCIRCHEMENQINYLIKKHREVMEKYLLRKLMESRERRRRQISIPLHKRRVSDLTDRIECRRCQLPGGPLRRSTDSITSSIWYNMYDRQRAEGSL